MTFARPLTCIVCLFLFLVGCSSVPPKDPGCIKTSVISTLSRVPLYTALEEDSRIATLAVEKVECDELRIAPSEGKANIGMNLKLTIPATRKDKGSNKNVVFPVFVALINCEDAVIDRHDEMIKVHVKRTALNHTHKIKYELPEGVSTRKQDYRILVGFNGSVHTISVDEKSLLEGKKVIHKNVSKKKNKRKK
ncbi:MAG: hypothetical protein FJX03_01710 [Alphaproteobacteria bacterium]|nr:hypothetical protein [Alphaproteobacteria bacterium]